MVGAHAPSRGVVARHAEGRPRAARDVALPRLREIGHVDHRLVEAVEFRAEQPFDPDTEYTLEIPELNVGLSLPDAAEKYGLSIALGSGEVTPLELAEAYATLARGGEHVRLREHATDPAPAPERLLDAGAVAAIADALSDPIARVRGLRTRGPFEFGYPVAVKTGTSTAFRDGWTAGFTRERTVVVWTGNASGAATNKLTGAVGAGPLFFDAMKRAMDDVRSRAPLYAPALLEEAEVCPLSGQRASHACSDHVRRLFPKGHTPTHSCNLHQFAVARQAPAGEPPWRCASSCCRRTTARSCRPSAHGASRTTLGRAQISVR